MNKLAKCCVSVSVCAFLGIVCGPCAKKEYLKFENFLLDRVKIQNFELIKENKDLSAMINQDEFIIEEHKKIVQWNYNAINTFNKYTKESQKKISLENNALKSLKKKIQKQYSN